MLTAIGKNPSIKSLNMTRSFTGMKLKHIGVIMDALVGLIQKDDFPLTELILAENKLKNDIHDFINALGSNQSLQKLGEFIGAGIIGWELTSFTFRYKRQFDGGHWRQASGESIANQQQATHDFAG